MILFPGLIITGVAVAGAPPKENARCASDEEVVVELPDRVLQAIDSLRGPELLGVVRV